MCSASVFTSGRRETISRKMSGRREMGGKDESSGEIYFSFFPVIPPSSSSSSSMSTSMWVSSVEAPSVSSSAWSDLGLLKNEESFFCFILSLTVVMIGKGGGDGDGDGEGYRV